MSYNPASAATELQTVEVPSSAVRAVGKNSIVTTEELALGHINEAAAGSSKGLTHTPNDIRNDDDNSDILPPPATSTATTAVALERWNHPKSNIPALAGTFLSFLILGMNDASPGPLIPYLERYYDLSYTVVSLIFLSPTLGYSFAAALNNTVHKRFGQRGVAFLAGLCHFITYLVFSLHPPWPVVIVIFILAGFGNGLADAAWCAWTGNMASANKVQGILQSCYSLGATISPLITTSMVTNGLPWYTWYYIMTAAGALEMVLCTWAFWHKTGARYRAETESGTTEKGGVTTWEALKNRVTVTCAFIFMTYVGSEVALGGWITTFMLRVRRGSPYASGVSATGFWAGMTLGRAALGFITERWGERFCVTIYLLISLGLELIFWLVPSFVASAIAVAFLGCFMGPIFPAGVVMCAKLLPQRLHVAALGASTALAGIGGAGVPFAVGAIAQKRGVWVLQPIVLALLSVIILLWLSLPRVNKQKGA